MLAPAPAETPIADALARATFYPVTGGSDAYWRNEAPARALGARFRPVPADLFEQTMEYPNEGTILPWRIVATDENGAETVVSHRAAWDNLTGTRVRDMRAVFPDTPGPAIFSRPGPERARLAAAMGEQGILTVAECDDNYLAPSRQNLFLRQNAWGPEHMEAHARSIGSFDRIVFSTARLRDTYAKGLRGWLGKQDLPELHVCRNSLPRADWPKVADYDGPLRVGFMGSPSHVWDIGLAFPGFVTARELGCEVVMVGYNPADPDPEFPDTIDTEDGPVTWRSKKSRDVKASWGKVVTRHVPWVDPGEYHRAPLPLDIGLCPLRTDTFTLGKSDVKAVEMVISGAVPVLQAHGVYRDGGWEHGINCLLASSPAEFGLCVKRLVKDPALRAELVAAGREKVYNTRNEDTLVHEWREALR